MPYRPRLNAAQISRRPLETRYAWSRFASRTSSSRFWAGNKLATTSKYPLSETVAQIRVPELLQHVTTDPIYATKVQKFMRTQIVSPSLCDDVLKYIGPSLEKYKGCDIIDINPGAGLWSQKLHEFLQPRTHILFESSPYFKPLLETLLQKPGSTYKYFEGDIGRHVDMERLIDAGLLPHQKRVRRGDAGAQELNESLLVTGSLVWEPRLPGIGFDSMTKQLLVQWGAKAWTNEGFHSFGPVRSLFWGASDDLRGCIPRASAQHSKYSFFMDVVGKNTEVVTAPHTLRGVGRGGSTGREPQHELESLIRAMQRGRENGMVLPSHRRENAHDFADEIERLTGGTGRMSFEEVHDYLEKKEQAGVSTTGLNMDGNIAVIHAEMDLKLNPDKYVELREVHGIQKKCHTAQGKAFAVKRATHKRAKKVKRAIEEVAALGEDIYNLECEALGMQDGRGKEAVLKALHEKEDQFKHILDTHIDRPYRTAALSETDDRLVLRSPVEILQWDRRPYEPLVMNPEEVWPQNRVSLIDITPRPLPPNVDSDWFEWIQDFIYALFSSPSSSVHSSLENVQPGAAQLAEESPLLRDPKKGGRMNFHNMRTRMLTVEMVHELCRAYREWPFKHEDANHSKHFRLRTGNGGGGGGGSDG